MKNIRFLIFLLFPFFLFSQETDKRLALVIGNSNYDKGELKNPVNDARLIASTLDSLDFDVILKENLENRSDFIQSIREFGNKRSEYDVAFVYYAGHGIQVDDENFLLPTKQDFSSEEDVLDFGVSVQNIMRYLRAQTNEVNILILDACRDNPFESKWNTTRSLKSQGLAKIPAPTGSLIAFSTDSGQTAPDGDGENSVYTVSLAKNMLLKDTSIDQVFRNVRAEVLSETDGMQRPVEATQLTGNTFYLMPNTYKDEFSSINNILISNKNLSEGLQISNIILNDDPNNYKALKKKADILALKGEFEKSDLIYKRLINLNPSDLSNYFSFIIHDNYSKSFLGLLGKRNKENYEIVKKLYEQKNNKNPWLDLVFSRYHITFEKNTKLIDELGVFESAKNEIAIDQALSIARDFVLVPQSFIVNKYLFLDWIFYYESYHYYYFKSFKEQISFFESYLNKRENIDISGLVESFPLISKAYYESGRINEYYELVDEYSEHSNISAEIAIYQDLYNLNMFLSEDFEKGIEFLYKANNLLDLNIDSLSGYAKIYLKSSIANQLCNYNFFFDFDFVETLRIANNYYNNSDLMDEQDKYLFQDENYDFDIHFHLSLKKYLSNVLLGSHQNANKDYERIKKLIEAHPDYYISEEIPHLMFKTKKEVNYIESIDPLDDWYNKLLAKRGKPELFLTDEGNILFYLLNIKSNKPPESGLWLPRYTKQINDFFILSTNSTNETIRFSKMKNIKASHLRIYAWNNFFSPRNLDIKYFDNSLKN